MNDESTKRRVPAEENTNNQLSTADLAEVGQDSPRTEMTQSRVEVRQTGLESRMGSAEPQGIETPPQRTETRSGTIPATDVGLASDVGRESVVSRSTDIGGRTDAGRNPSQAAAPAPAMAQEKGPLFAGSEANELRSRWDSIQVGFVDEPRRAVEQADNLVAGTMKRLAEIFTEERNKLEHQWDQGENVSTEDLRQALRRYRSFFDRLLSV
jgi:hypothetical protein